MATKLNEIYKCEVCGNIVEIVHSGMGELVCCNEPMKIQKENTQDAAIEKHIPKVNINENILEIQIGDILHPMEDKHYIEWIELITKDKSYKQFLTPNIQPIVQFQIENNFKIESIRAYCNIHGLWKKDI